MYSAAWLRYGRHMRVQVASALTAIGALVLTTPALASSLSVTAPASVQEEHTIPVHVTGTADEPELAWTAFVQNEAGRVLPQWRPRA